MFEWLAWARTSIDGPLGPGSLRGRLAKGTFWSLVGTVGYQGMVLLASLFTARLLGRDVFGELGMIQGTVGMFGVFAGMGLGMTATKHVAEFRRARPDRAGRVIGMVLLLGLLIGGSIALALVFVSRWIAASLIHAPHLAMELRIGCALLFFSAVNQVQQGALAGFEGFKAIAKINIATGLLSFPLVVGGTYLWQLPGGVTGMALAAAAGCTLSHLALRAQCRRSGVRLDFRGLRRELPIVWQFSVPSFLAGAIASPVMWAACALLANQPGGYAELGLYNAARQWWLLILFVPTAMSRAVLPILTERLETADRRGARKALLAAMGLNGTIAVTAAAALTVFGREAMALFGGSFEDGSLVLVLMVWTAAVLAVQAPVGRVIAASGRMWLGFCMNVGWAGVLLTSFWWMKEWGAVGLGGSLLLAYAVHTTWTLLFALRFVMGDSAAEPAEGVRQASSRTLAARAAGRLRKRVDLVGSER